MAGDGKPAATPSAKKGMFCMCVIKGEMLRVWRIDKNPACGMWPQAGNKEGG